MVASEVHPHITLLIAGTITSLHNRNWIIYRIVGLLVLSAIVRLATHVVNDHEGSDTESEKEEDRKFSQYIEFFTVGIASGAIVAHGLKSPTLISLKSLYDFTGFILTLAQLLI